jgi:DNA-binding protein H-NS
MAAAVCTAAVSAVYPRITHYRAARLLDQSSGLHDRLTTALELTATSSPLAALQRNSALEAVGGIVPKQVAPLRLHRSLMCTTLLTTLLLSLRLLPMTNIPAAPAVAGDVELVKAHGAQLASQMRMPKPKEIGRTGRDFKRTAEKAGRLAEAMQRGAMDKRRAMVEMHQLTKELEQLRREAGSSSQRSLEQAARELEQASAVWQALRNSASTPTMSAGKDTPRPPSAPSGDPPHNAEARGAGGARNPAEFNRNPLQNPPSYASLPQLVRTGKHKEVERFVEQALHQLKSRGASEAEHRQVDQMLRDIAKALQGTEMRSIAETLQRSAEVGPLQSKQAQQRGSIPQPATKSILRNADAAEKGENAAETERMISMWKQSRLELGAGRTPTPAQSSGSPPAGGAGNRAGTGSSLMPVEPKHLPDPHQGTVSRITGRRGTGSMEAPSIASPGEPSVVKLTARVFEQVQQAQKSAESPSGRERIPPGYRTQVRNYYRLLQR